MKITTYEHPLTKETSYQIMIDTDDNIEPFDLAESFKSQYPGIKAVINKLLNILNPMFIFIFRF